MFSPRIRLVALAIGAAFLLALGAHFGPRLWRQLPKDSVARAVETGDPKLLEASVAEKLDVNARDAAGRTPLFLAIEKRDAEMIGRLVEAGADLNAADGEGHTPLMLAASEGDEALVAKFLASQADANAEDLEHRSAAHYALQARSVEVLRLLLAAMPELSPVANDRPDLLAQACATEDLEVIAAVLEHSPSNLEWNVATRGALSLALENWDDETTRLLLAKHPAPPTLEGSNVPLLAEAIVNDEIDTCSALLEAGADPNAPLPTPLEKDFSKRLPSNVRDYARADEGITPLMIAAGKGDVEMVRTLLDAGAARNRMTKKFKMLALYFAVRTEQYRAVQMLLGSGPTPDDLRIEISLTKQRASVIKAGQAIFQTQCSTGRSGFATPAGSYVITDKKRDHVSSIYKVAMPYFMRLNCRDFGMHEGAVPNYPASHGCIRLPSAAAKKLFSEIPVGTVVMIN